jgi:hypothetical protein
MRAAIWYGTLSLAIAATHPLVAQAPALKPGLDVKKLEAWVGVWNYEGDAKATPIGPAAKISGVQTGRLVGGGFALEWAGQEKGAFGGVQWGEIDTYDAATKSYPYLGYQTDGTTWSGVNTIAGTVWKNSGTIVVKGVAYKQRGEFTPSADGNTFVQKIEISSDGRTWMPWTDVRMTKSTKP